MQIIGDELIKLILTPMTDIKMVETIDSLGWEQPIIDEKYEMDQYIAIGGSDDDIGFNFKEVDGYSIDGEPCLTQIDFYSDRKIKAPFNLNFTDTYDTCCRKIEKIANFNDKTSKKLKIWIIDAKYFMVINFKDKELTRIKTIIISNFDDDSIDEDMFENKD